MKNYISYKKSGSEENKMKEENIKQLITDNIVIVVLILLVVTCYVLLKSFLQIATGTSETAKVSIKKRK